MSPRPPPNARDLVRLLDSYTSELQGRVDVGRRLVGLLRAELERWTVYHSAMLLLFRADDSSKSGTGSDLDYLITEFHRSVASA